mgnify:CR=1 FL=1
MINEQMDIYFVEGNQQRGYSQYSTKIGVILPPNPQRNEPDPVLIFNFEPKKNGKMVVMPKGQKPNQAGQQQQGYQAPQGGFQHGGNPQPNYQQGDPGAQSQADYNNAPSGQHPYQPR